MYGKALRTLAVTTFGIALVACGWLGGWATAPASAQDGAKARFFELRVYTANEGKLEALNARFRNHTNKLFIKHGMTPIAYWVPTAGEESKNVLLYVLAYPSREARDASWKAFQNDPDWKTARDASEKDGKLVAKVESKYMTAVDYSPIK
jgi:hypothetical protein